MGNVVIRAEGLGKRYWIGGAAREDTLRDTLAAVATAPFRRAAALRGAGARRRRPATKNSGRCAT